MANEKSNNVRILQSTKKTSLSPLITAVIGFLAGVSVISIAGFIFMNMQANENKNLAHQAEQPLEVQQHALNEPNTAPAQTVHSEELSVADHTQHQHEQIEHGPNDEPDVQTVDPVNAFKHPTAVKPQQLANTHPATQAQDPFALAQVAPKNSVINTIKTVKPNVAHAQPLQAQVKPASVTTPAVKPVAKVTKPIVAEEPEPESPRGSLQVTVTKTIAPVKEIPKEPKAES